MSENITLYVISHTHWDREWYESFQNYRFRLVRLMDDLIDILENIDEYKVFHLDGQTIVLEDYLEIRPQNDTRIRRLIESGKLIIGPWYVMPDEFLVSGESLVRNLQKGIEICNKYNAEYMRNGYVTDIFGHNGQFPQILHGFGIKSATLFRGVGNYPKDLFNWEGTDGSVVTAYRMDPDRCYSNFYFSLRMPFEGKEIDEEDFIKRAKEMIERSKKAGASNAFLMMDGVDHVDAEPQIPYMINLMNEKIDGITVKHANISEYIAAVEKAEKNLDTLKGPLYKLGEKGLNNRVLKNVLSSMVHLKQANDHCETTITRWAEPLDFAALNFIVTNKSSNLIYPKRDGFIEEAWKQILQNHPHDSICGCSITDVHLDNEYRFRQASQIIDRITQDAMEEISEQVDTSDVESDLSFVVFNPSQNDIEGYTTLSLDMPIETYRNFKLYDIEGVEIPYQILSIDGLYNKRQAQIRELIKFITFEKCTLSLNLRIPGNGYAVIHLKKLVEVGPGPCEYLSREEPDRTRYLGTMRTSRTTWDNGKIILEAAQNGTLTITNKMTKKQYFNVLSFEDCGDIGDGWDYVKPLMDSEYITICGECDVHIDSDGPFAMKLTLTRRIPLPNTSGQKGRSTEKKETEIQTQITLLKDSSTIHVITKVDNSTTNHRLRVLVPTGFDTDEFFTLTPFDLQNWTVKKPDYSTFKEIETFINPTQGVTFLTDGKDSIGIFAKGLYEIEVCENDRTAALTLFRAFSNEVGQFNADLGHMKKSMEFEYAISFNGEQIPSHCLLEGMSYKTGLRTCPTGKHKGILPMQTSFLKIDCNYSIQSALYSNSKDSDVNLTNILRIFNPSDLQDKITINIPNKEISEASLVNFKGDVLRDLIIKNGAISLTADPHKILTISFKIEDQS